MMDEHAVRRGSRTWRPATPVRRISAGHRSNAPDIVIEYHGGGNGEGSVTRLQKLLSIASEPLSPGPSEEKALCEVTPELGDLLSRRDGFVAFESALVVFPTRTGSGVPGIQEWNDPAGWRSRYRDVLAPEYCCFAHDLFGTQFAISPSEVIRLDPEVGHVERYASTLEEWAKRLLQNYREDTAWPLAHDWQLLNGVLPPGSRLLPRQPFVLGGEFEVDNLVAVECQQAMAFWGMLYEGIREVPEGQPVHLSGWIR